MDGSYVTGSRDFGSVTGTVVGTSLVARSRSTPFGTTCDDDASITDGTWTIAGTLKCSDSSEGAFSVRRA